MIKKLLLTFCLLLCSVIAAQATEITVSSSQWFAGSYRYAGTTATLRIYYSQSFLSSTNVNVVGGAIGSSGWYKQVACTITSATLNCASFTLESTIDSNKPNTRFFAVLYDQSGARRETLMGDASGWIVPASPTTTTVAQLLNAQGTGIPNPPASYLNSQQVQTLINTAVGTLNDATETVKGRTKLSVAAVSATNPIAVGDNDPRVVAGTNAVSCAGTDDTAALNTALAAGGTVVIGKGVTCAASSSLSFTSSSTAILRIDRGGLFKPITGQTPVIGGYYDIGVYQAFTNALAGQGTVSLLGRSIQEVYPEWWGASPTASAVVNTPALQAAIIGAYGNTRTNGSGNWIYNRILKFSGIYDINDELDVYHMIGFRWEGQNKLNSGINQTAVNKRIIDGQSVSYGVFNQIRFTTAVSQNLPLVDLDYSGAQGEDLRPQNITFSDCVIQGNNVGYIGVQIAKSGGGSQGDNVRFNNCYINGFTQAGAQLGGGADDVATAFAYNAIDVRYIGGDIQSCPKYGLAAYGGNWVVEGTTFENSTAGAYQQTGFDILINSGQHPSVAKNCRTESTRFSSGVDIIENVKQTPIISGAWYNTNGGQSLGGTAGWEVNHTITGTTVGGDGKIYKITTGGTFGGLGLTAVASAGASTLTVAGTPWTIDAFAGYKVSIISGTGSPAPLISGTGDGETAQSIVVASNTNNTLTLASPWTIQPDATSTFVIEPNWGTQTTSGSVVFELIDYFAVINAKTILDSKFVGGKISLAPNFRVENLEMSRRDAFAVTGSTSGPYDGIAYGRTHNILLIGSPVNGAGQSLVRKWFVPSYTGDLAGLMLKDYTQFNLGAQKVVWSESANSNPNARFADVWIGRGGGIAANDAAQLSKNILAYGGMLGRLTPTGTDQAGVNTNIQVGLPTGSGLPGNLNIYAPAAVGATGTTIRTGVIVAGVSGRNGISWTFKGADVASAAAIVPTGNLFHVTGTTNITSITATGITAGTEITIIFDDVLTFTDGSNLTLAGNFVTSAGDTITLKFDGTSFFEICRSVN